MAQIGLEARYRRLLRWFPVDHRTAHGEEMLGVLMAAAPDGRDRPGAAEAADLLIGAARIRLRPARALSDRDGWRDALAMFSLAGPVLAFAVTCLAYLVTDLWSVTAGLGGFSYTFGAFDVANPLVSTILWLVIYGQGLVVLLALCGLRRSAALAAAIPMLYGLITEVRLAFLLQGAGVTLLAVAFIYIAPIVEIVALLASPGPRRGRELLRRTHWAVLAAAALAGAALTARYDVIATMQPRYGPGPTVSLITQAAAVLILLLLLISTWLSSTMGKRLAVLFALVAYPAMLTAAYRSGHPSWATSGYFQIFCEVLIVCLLAAVVYRTRRRSRSARSGQGDQTA